MRNEWDSAVTLKSWHLQSHKPAYISESGLCASSGTLCGRDPRLLVNRSGWSGASDCVR